MNLYPETGVSRSEAIDHLVSALRRYDHISFDMYDTLVNRNVSRPEDLFEYAAATYFGAAEGMTDFKSRRLEAYRRACERFSKSATLDEIYDCLDAGAEAKQKLKAAERALEKEAATPNAGMVDVYNRLKSLGKHLYILSDMYLDSALLEEILEKCGVTGYERLYVSCEHRCSKLDGGLYRRACEEIGIRPSELAHVGDNWKNDLVRALTIGVRPFLIRKPCLVKRYYADYDGPDLLPKTVAALIENGLPERQTEFERLGYALYGPLLWGFSTWLKDRLEADGIEKVCFLSREGAILKWAFEHLFPGYALPVRYLYASRRSAIIPSYCAKRSYEDVVDSMAMPGSMTVEDLFKRWSLDIRKYGEALAKCGLQPGNPLNGRALKSNAKIRALFDEVKEDLFRQSEGEYRHFKRYLEEQDFRGRVAVVDVGWNGGMQKALESLPFVRENDTQVHGYYFGINSRQLGARLSHASGYLYEYEKNDALRILIYGFAGVFELGLPADHGSVVGYEPTEDGMRPVLRPHEYRTPGGEKLPELRAVEDLQAGARAFVEDVARLTFLKGAKLAPDDAFRNYRRFACNPRLGHLEAFREFGANDLGSEQILISGKYRRLRGPFSAMNGLARSTWKIGQMKYLCRLPLPYDRLYVHLRKKDE